MASQGYEKRWKGRGKRHLRVTWAGQQTKQEVNKPVRYDRLKTSKLTLGGAPEERIQLSKAYDFRVLMTQNSAVTFLTKEAVTCGWGAEF